MIETWKACILHSPLSLKSETEGSLLKVRTCHKPITVCCPRFHDNLICDVTYGKCPYVSTTQTHHSRQLASMSWKPNLRSYSCMPRAHMSITIKPNITMLCFCKAFFERFTPPADVPHIAKPLGPKYSRMRNNRKHERIIFFADFGIDMLHSRVYLTWLFHFKTFKGSVSVAFKYLENIRQWCSLTEKI